MWNRFMYKQVYVKTGDRLIQYVSFFLRKKIRIMYNISSWPLLYYDLYITIYKQV